MKTLNGKMLCLQINHWVKFLYLIYSNFDEHLMVLTEEVKSILLSQARKAVAYRQFHTLRLQF